MHLTRFVIFAILILLIDWYFYQAISTVLKTASTGKKNLVFYIYAAITTISVLTVLTPIFYPYVEWNKFFRIYFFAAIAILLFSKIIGVIFLLIDDIIRLFRWIGSYLVKPETSDAIQASESSHKISRLKFLNYVALGMTAIPFAGFIYGMVRGAFNYTIHRTRVVLPNLPPEFNGFKIVQLSDIHSGSFTSTKHVEEAVRIVLEQNADVIFFTGDLVNNEATEMRPFMNVLNKLNAPHGVFSTLGNHDYGDYVQWETPQAKKQNLDDLKDVHKQLGWRLLMNEHVPLTKGDASIALLGVENWGGNLSFPKYGDLKKAHTGTEKYPVKLLLSHDPSHWDKQVKPEYGDIDITFSGHTHGFQMGMEVPGFKWSPSKYIYKEWAGLYTDGNQHIYVNRGLGFLGYPGRVGISPEITVMELYNA
ncbi:MAG TPA: metallophosphoesterase [Bacteroidia bacterium]|nr:metallophosphoesterase [Bacteroidia bacterium]